MKTILVLATLVAATGAYVASLPNYLFPPMDGVRIGTSETSSGHSLWSIQQFQSPPLSGFVGNWAHDASAGVLFFPGNPATVRMRATSYGDACLNAQGHPIEQDLFLHGPRPAMLPTLASLGGLAVGVDLQAIPSGPADQVCALNAVEVSIDFDVVDATAVQDFSYGIAVGNFGAKHGATSMVAGAPWGNWFQHTATAFGFAEPVTAYLDMDGAPLDMLSQNVMTPYDFDALPRIKAAIATGAQWGMDQDLSHWRIASVTLGEHDFGHSQIVVYARGMQVTMPP